MNHVKDPMQSRRVIAMDKSRRYSMYENKKEIPGDRYTATVNKHSKHKPYQLDM